MKNAKKILAVLVVMIALTFVMSLSILAAECTEHDYVETGRVQPESTTVPGKVIFTCSKCSAVEEKDIKLFEVADKNGFNSAQNSADEYDIIRLTANTSIDQVILTKPVTFDLNGFTLTTSSTFSGVLIGGGASFINGTLLHTGKTSAIKAYNTNIIADILIKIESPGNNVGGISTRNATDAKGNGHINVLKNVTMIGTGNYGIETYQAASSTEPVIDLIENVKIDSLQYGIDLRFPLGTIKDSIISGSSSGIATQNSGITMNFEGNNEIMGDENAILVQNGSVSITADKYTNFVNSSGGDIVFNVPSACAASSSFNIVGYTVSGNTFTECEHESTGGSCTVRAECTKCTKVLGYVHNYVEKVEERIPADCTVQGTAFMYCDCGAETTEFVPRDPNAHVWQETTTPATCTADGGTTYNCKYGSCVGEEYTNPIPALGHDIIIDAKGTPATCTQPGMTNAEHCSRCTQATKLQTPINALGHNIVELEGVPATCTETGLTRGEKCTRCTGATVAQITLPALGHDIVVDPAAPATCTQTGLTEGQHCSRCTAEKVEQQDVAALGHDIVVDAAEVAPTCTTAGSTKAEHCSRCSAMTVTSTAIPALGHDIVVDAAEVAPTCTTAGSTKAEHCSRCNDVTVTATAIPALGHTWVDATEDAPKTCTTCALTEGEKLPSGLGTGAIVGIAVGGVAVLGGGGFCLWWFVFRKKFI